MKRMYMLFILLLLAFVARGQGERLCSINKFNPLQLEITGEQQVLQVEFEYATAFGDYSSGDMAQDIRVYKRTNFNQEGLKVEVRYVAARKGEWRISVGANLTGRERFLEFFTPYSKLVIIQAAKVIINDYTATGGGVIYPGSMSTFMLSGSEVGAEYKVKQMDGAWYGPTLQGTGEPLRFSERYSDGKYKIIASKDGYTKEMSGWLTLRFPGALDSIVSITPPRGLLTCLESMGEFQIETIGEFQEQVFQDYFQACNKGQVHRWDSTYRVQCFRNGLKSCIVRVFMGINYSTEIKFSTMQFGHKWMLDMRQMSGVESFTRYSLSGGGMIPTGGSTSLQLSGSQKNVKYKLERNNQYAGSSLDGTGSALTFSGINIPGMYRVYANFGEKGEWVTDSVEVYPDILFYTLSGGGTIYNNRPVSLSLSGSQSVLEYSLLKNGVVYATLAGTGSALSFEVRDPGTYTVEARFRGHRKIMTGTIAIEGYDGLYLSLDRNHESVNTYLDPTTTTSAARYITDVSYLDGLGRPVQEIQVGAAPGGGDIILPHHYGRFGKEERVYLPYTKQGNGGSFLGDALNVSRWEGMYGSAEAPYANAVQTCDDSPLNRMLEQVGAGKAWQTGGKKKQYAYLSNTANEVRLWQVDTGTGKPVSGGYYPAGVIQKVTLVDEDGHRVEKFTSKDGLEILTVSYDGAVAHRTFNVYDNLGRLCWVIPPAVADGTSLTADQLDKYCYSYLYDDRGLLIEKKLPGVTAEYYLYDARERLVLSQDGNQRGINKWIYHQYDTFDRETESGECTLATAISALRTAVRASGNYIPSGKTPLMYTWYDHYNYPGMQAFDTTRTYHAAVKDFVSGQVTGIKEKVLDDAGTSWIMKTVYYDDRGRAIQTLKTLYPSGTEITSVEYDFTGNILNERKHVNYSGTSTTVLTSLERDTRGRLLKEKQKVNGGAEVTLNEYTYDGLGRQKSRKIHGGIETLVNEYNTRGWLTAIRGSKFTEELRYNEPLLSSDTSVCFNGNISSMTWKNGTGERQAYLFQYDGLNRLKQALYGSGATTVAKTGKHDVTGLTYDKNGNILTLKRKNNGTLVDDLVYRYAGNRLMNVKDGTDNAFGYAGTSALTENRYDYDGNGNLLKDLNKKITGVTYNFLNLTREVTTNGRLTRYTYTAGGEKLRVAYPGKTLNHVGNLVFEGSSLKYIFTGSGRHVVNGSSGAHEYHLSDHLGNVRVVLNQSGGVIQLNDYYPFGMLMAQSGSSDNKYLYNGNELQEETGWLDYGWRMYDATVGRWGCMDPLSENHYDVSGYAYVLNNPLSYMDYLGLDNVPWDEVYWPGFDTGNDVIELDEVGVTAKRGRGGFIGFGSSASQYFENNRHGDYWQEQGLKIHWDNTIHNKQLDQLQNVLDVMGVVPVFGEAFDGINAGIYFLRGDNLNGSLSAAAMMPIAGWAATGAKVGIKVGSKVIAKGTVAYRYMSKGELDAILKTGYLRGGDVGKTYFTKDLYKSASKAQQRLSLGGAPQIRVEFEILNNINASLHGAKVTPLNGMPGKGSEFMTLDRVSAKVLNWQSLGN